MICRGSRGCYNHGCRSAMCTAAAAEYHRQRRRGVAHRFSREPLRFYVTSDPDGFTERYMGRHGVTYHQARSVLSNFARPERTMIDQNTADRICIALGLHPVMLWPEWLDLTGDDEEVAA